MSFNTFMLSYNHYLYQITDHFHYNKNLSLVPLWSLLFPSPVNHWSDFCACRFAYSRMLYKSQSYVFFRELGVFSSLMLWKFIHIGYINTLSLLLSSMTLYDVAWLVYPFSSWGSFELFPVFDLGNKAAMNIHTGLCVEICFQFSWFNT